MKKKKLKNEEFILILLDLHDGLKNYLTEHFKELSPKSSKEKLETEASILALYIIRLGLISTFENINPNECSGVLMVAFCRNLGLDETSMGHFIKQATVRHFEEYREAFIGLSKNPKSMDMGSAILKSISEEGLEKDSKKEFFIANFFILLFSDTQRLLLKIKKKCNVEEFKPLNKTK